MQDIRSRKENNAPTLLAISMAMRIRRYGAERIAEYGRSRATLDAAERRDWGKYRIAPADAMVINFGVKNRVVAL